jgi:nucleoside-diphosphate-sugar epimerase
MKYLVTGGAGFIGSALTKSLLKDGHRVNVLDNFSRGKEARLYAAQARIFDGDIRDEYLVKRAMQGCDAVIHLAYLQGTQTFYSEPRQVLDVALRGILNVLSACEATGCADLLLVSSSEAYQVAPVTPTPENIPLVVPDVLNPRYSYGGGKIASEITALAWQRTGVLDRLIIARPHNIIGPDMGREHVVPEFALRMNRLTAEQPSGLIDFPIQGSGLETRSFCYIDDCVDQLTLLLDKAPQGAEVYHVGVEIEKTISQVAVEVARNYFRDIQITPGKLPQGSPPRRLPDTRKIRELVAGPDNPNYPPGCGSVSFKDAIAKTVRWYQDNG